MTADETREILRAIALEADTMRARERAEAALLITHQGYALYCAGPGRPIERVERLGDWDSRRLR